MLYFIGQCLSLDEHPTFRETIIAQFSKPDYDWNQFIWTCSNHLVLPVIYLKFLKHDLLSYVPEVLAHGYSGDIDPPSPVILTPIKDDGSENSND